MGESACPLNTFHYAAGDQRGGYQQKQGGYQRGGYEHVKSLISSSYSPVHSFLPSPMNAVATLHLERPPLLFLAHYLVLP